MRLVRGASLSDVLAESRTDSASSSLPRWLDVHSKVCDAVAYAHSRVMVHGVSARRVPRGSRVTYHRLGPNAPH